MIIMTFIFNIIFQIEKILNMSFENVPTTIVTSGMEPFWILLDGSQPLVLQGDSS